MRCDGVSTYLQGKDSPLKEILNSYMIIFSGGLCRIFPSSVMAFSTITFLLSLRLESLSSLLDDQKRIVRQIKERVAEAEPAVGGGRGTSGVPASSINDHPEVRLEVDRLLELKRAVTDAEDALGDAHANIAIRERMAASGRRAALWDAFSPPPPLASPPEASAATGIASVESASLRPGSSNAISSSQEDGKATGIASGYPSAHTSEGGPEVLMGCLSDDVDTPVAYEGELLGLDLFKVSATWQLPAQPLFFGGDRATVKVLARESVEWLQTETRW